MKRLITLAVLPALLLISTPGHGQEPKRTPLDELRGSQEYALLLCSIVFMKEQATAQLGRDAPDSPSPPGAPNSLGECIITSRAETQSKYRAAAATVRKAKAREALASAQVAFMTALAGINPGHDERKITYSARQQSLKDRLNEAWARFEIEQ